MIELLVVIAIIGILASIVLVSLSGARNRAKDARIQTSMVQIRSIGEMIYGEENSYENLCTPLLTHLKKVNRDTSNFRLSNSRLNKKQA